MKAMVAALVVASLGVTQAAQARQQLVYGVGLSSCGQWLGERRVATSDGVSSELQMMMSSWVTGFVSAVLDVDDVHRYKPTDAHGMQVFLDQYCQKNPNDSLHHAAEALMAGLRQD
jgi:hypothetical protein